MTETSLIAIPAKRIVTSLLGLLLVPAFCATAAAADAVSTEPSQLVVGFWWLVSLAGSLTALYFAWQFYLWMAAQDPGDEKMQEISEAVRQGAWAYLSQQYKVVGIFFAVVCLLLILVSFGLKTQSGWVPLAFLTGGLFSGLAGFFGMKTATMANCRTAQGAKESLNKGLQVAFRSGSVMGLTVVGLGLLDICLWFAVLYWIVPVVMPAARMSLESITVTMLCFGMGASSQALFARVGGGIFTKAADVGADLVGKVEAGIPEDDPRNPAVIADNVGDNVGDVAGMGADLYESYCGSILACAALGVAAFPGVPSMQMALLLLPMAMAGVGIFLSIAGIYQVRTEEGASQMNLLKALARGVNSAAALSAVAAALLVILMVVLPSLGMGETFKSMGLIHLPYGWSLLGIFGAIIAGLGAGWAIGEWTTYSTSQEFAPTKEIARQSQTGPATVIIAGIAEGFQSVWFPIVITSAAILLSFGLCTGFQFENSQTFALGLYGIGISAVGMLSTLGITLATDAYGPIADNAGGNAEMSHQPPEVRQRTDALDSLGNTTAATGKGFAIGSAALTALALLAAYVEEVRVGLDRWAMSSTVIQPKAVTREGGVFVPARLLTRDLLAVSGEDLEKVTGDKRAAEEKTRALLVLPVTETRVGKQLTVIRSGTLGEMVEIDLKYLIDDGKVAPVYSATIPDFVTYYRINVMNPKVMVGMFMGTMLVFVFCAMTMKSVGRAAYAMVEEVRRQFRENAGIMEGTSKPDYASCVAISTKAAQREMVLPSLIALVIPLLMGLLTGVAGVMGMLAGGLTSGFAVAIMMANSGGAWDNAKKYVESGQYGGKKSDAHKATVVGDTVGDPFKDTSGPSLNILIKLMSMVSVVFAGLVVRYSLTALGVF